MKRRAFAWIAIVGAFAVPTAWACTPVPQEMRVRDFITGTQPPNAVIFTGKVISVSKHLRADGTVVTDTWLQPTKWWRGYLAGLVVVRSIISTKSPCPGLGRLDASVGEQRLILGVVRNTITESWVQFGEGVLLNRGHIPVETEQELRQMAIDH